VLDVGTSIGKPTVDLAASGPILGQVPKSDLEAERAKLQDQANDFGFVPQVSLGVSYRY